MGNNEYSRYTPSSADFSSRWGYDRHGANRLPHDCVPLEIGDVVTWVGRCRWASSRGRCSKVAGLQDLCRWHYDCATSDRSFAEDKKAFDQWGEKNNVETTDEDFEMIIGELDPYQDRRFEK